MMHLGLKGLSLQTSQLGLGSQMPVEIISTFAHSGKTTLPVTDSITLQLLAVFTGHEIRCFYSHFLGLDRFCGCVQGLKQAG